MAESKAKYRVQTANFVVELESDEELVQLARVETIQKDTLVKMLPNGSYVPARNLPILKEVWGLVPKLSSPPLSSPEGAGTGIFKATSVPPIPSKGGLSISSMTRPNAQNVGMIPPPAPVAPPAPIMPPRLETVVDFMPRGEQIDAPTPTIEDAFSPVDVMLNERAEREAADVAIDRKDADKAIYSLIHHESIVEDVSALAEAEEEDVVLSSLSREIDVVDAFRDMVDAPSVNIARDDIFDSLDMMSCDMMALKEADALVEKSGETHILNGDVVENGRSDTSVTGEAAFVAPSTSEDDEKLAEAEVHAASTTAFPFTSKRDEPEEDTSSTTEWSDSEVCLHEETVVTRPNRDDSNIRALNDIQAQRNLSQIEIDVSDLEEEQTINPVSEEALTHDMSAKAEEIRQWTKAHVEKAQSLTASDLASQVASQTAFARHNGPLDYLATSDVAVVSSENAQTNAVLLNHVIERAQTKPVMQKDVERVIEEDKTCDRRSINESDIRAAAQHVGQTAAGAASCDAGGGVFDVASQTASASDWRPVDPNVANAARLSAYQKQNQAPADELEVLSPSSILPIIDSKSETLEQTPEQTPETASVSASHPSKAARTWSPHDLEAARAAVDAAQKDPEYHNSQIIQNLSSILDAIVKSQTEEAVADQSAETSQAASGAAAMPIASLFNEEDDAQGRRPSREVSRYSVSHTTCPGARAPLSEDEKSKLRNKKSILLDPDDIDDSPSEQFMIHSREDFDAMMRSASFDDVRRSSRRDHRCDLVDDEEVSMSEKLRIRKHRDLVKMIEKGEMPDDEPSRPSKSGRISVSGVQAAPTGELRALFEKENELNIYLENEIQEGERESSQAVKDEEKPRKRMSKAHRSSHQLPGVSKKSESARLKENARSVDTQVGVVGASGDNTEVHFNKMLRDGEKLVARFGSLMLTNRRLWVVEKSKHGLKNFESYDLKCVQWSALRDESHWQYMLLDILAVVVTGVVAYFMRETLLYALLIYFVLMFPVCWFISFKTTLMVGAGSVIVRARERVTKKNHAQAAKFLERLDRERARYKKGRSS